MNDLVLLVIRVLLAGFLVAGFAMLGDTLRPKMFAGLFAGAPSVATVSLLVTGSRWVRPWTRSTRQA